MTSLCFVCKVRQHRFLYSWYRQIGGLLVSHGAYILPGVCADVKLVMWKHEESLTWSRQVATGQGKAVIYWWVVEMKLTHSPAPLLFRWYSRRGQPLLLAKVKNSDRQDSQVYIPKRHILIQVLPPANAYTKSAHAYIHFAKFFCHLLMHVCIFIAIRPVCGHHGVRIGCLIAILRQNAYMHEQILSNIRIWGEEAPVWAYAFWVCKPVDWYIYLVNFPMNSSWVSCTGPCLWNLCSKH